VHRTSAGAAHTFGEGGPNGGFGVWWLFPPIPALAGNAIPLGTACENATNLRKYQGVFFNTSQLT